MKNIRVWMLDANSAVNKNRSSTPKGAVEKKYSVFEQSAENPFDVDTMLGNISLEKKRNLIDLDLTCRILWFRSDSAETTYTTGSRTMARITKRTKDLDPDLVGYDGMQCRRCFAKAILPCCRIIPMGWFRDYRGILDSQKSG